MANNNKIKTDRYREALVRINSSIRTKHYFEAITIVESILSDRIASFILSTGTLTNKKINELGFAQLITVWRVATKTPGNIWGDCEQLISNVDQWRTSRNKYVHGLVKFPNQKAAMVTTEEFIDGAKQTAENGKELADLVGKWRAEQIQRKSAYTRDSKIVN